MTFSTALLILILSSCQRPHTRPEPLMNLESAGPFAYGERTWVAGSTPEETVSCSARVLQTDYPSGQLHFFPWPKDLKITENCQWDDKRNHFMISSPGKFRCPIFIRGHTSIVMHCQWKNGLKKPWHAVAITGASSEAKPLAEVSITHGPDPETVTLSWQVMTGDHVVLRDKSAGEGSCEVCEMSTQPPVGSLNLPASSGPYCVSPGNRVGSYSNSVCYDARTLETVPNCVASLD